MEFGKQKPFVKIQRQNSKIDSTKSLAKLAEIQTFPAVKTEENKKKRPSTLPSKLPRNKLVKYDK